MESQGAMLSALPFKPHPSCGSGKPDTTKEQLIPGLGNTVHELPAGKPKEKDIGPSLGNCAP